MSMFDKRKDNEPAAESRATASASGNAPENRPHPPENQVRGTAMIGKTITIKGDITGEENLVIEGKVDGSVQLKKNDLTVGQSGRVTADLTANVVRIDGEVKGDIVGTEKVVITKTGRVQGNIVGPRVTGWRQSIDMDPSGADKASSQAPKSVPTGGKPMAVEDKPNEAANKY